MKIFRRWLAYPKRPTLPKPEPVVVRFAKTKLFERVGELQSKIGVIPTRLHIRNQRRRWGSCSSRGTISLNYRVALLPQCLADYVIIHELCHIKEMNHGPRFWALVATHCPNYSELVPQLRQVEKSFAMTAPQFEVAAKQRCCGRCSQLSVLE